MNLVKNPVHIKVLQEAFQGCQELSGVAKGGPESFKGFHGCSRGAPENISVQWVSKVLFIGFDECYRGFQEYSRVSKVLQDFQSFSEVIKRFQKHSRGVSWNLRILGVFKELCDAPTVFQEISEAFYRISKDFVDI